MAIISMIMKKITLKDLHEINNKFPNKKNIHQSYQYDVKKDEWKFVGYKCGRCNRVFKRPGFIENHEEVCRPDKKLANQKIEGEQIMTVDREVWKPIDINQNQSFQKTK